MRKHFPTLVTIFVLIAGMLWSVPNIQLEAGQWINIEFVVMFGICALYIKNIWLKLFFCFCVVRDYAIMSFITWNTLHTVVLCAILYQVIADFKPNRTAILNSICGIALFNTAIVFMQKAGYWMFFQPVGYQQMKLASVHLTGFMFPICRYATDTIDQFPGFFGNIDVTSAFVASVIPLFFRDRWFWFIPIMLYCLIILGALGGLAAICLTAIVLIYLYQKSWLLWAILFVFGVGIGYIWWTDDWYAIVYRGAERIPTWIEYLKLMPGHMTFGYGLGKVATLYPVLASKLGANYLHPHNEFICTFVETGFVGLFLVCGFLWSLLRKAKGIVFGGLIAAIACSLTIFSLHTAIGLVPLMYAALTEADNV